MTWLYPVAFWLLWISLPALWVGYVHWSWVRGLTVAAAVIIAPFGVTLALTTWGGPGDWANAAAIDSWITRCITIGAPAGYALGILLPLAGFRYRDRRLSAPPRAPATCPVWPESPPASDIERNGGRLCE